MLFFLSVRHGDQLIEVNNQSVSDLGVEDVYDILDKTPPGRVYIRVVPVEQGEKLPSHLNDALEKLQSERELLDKRMTYKTRYSAAASTMSGSSDSCGKNVCMLLCVVCTVPVADPLRMVSLEFRLAHTQQPYLFLQKAYNFFFRFQL